MINQFLFNIHETSRIFILWTISKELILKYSNTFQKKEEKNFLEVEFESGSCDKVLEFLEMMGKAKHEPRYLVLSRNKKIEDDKLQN